MDYNKVLNFISAVRNSFGGAHMVYTRGSCYQFYLVLKQVFPDAIAFYNSDHVITKIGTKFFDISGEVQIANHLPVGGYYYSHEDLIKLRYEIKEKE